MWTSTFDGKDFKRLGKQHYTTSEGADEAGNYDCPIQDLQWLPGDRKLSFVFQDHLYLIPAD